MGKNSTKAQGDGAAELKVQKAKVKEVIFYAFTVGNGLTGFKRLANNFFLTYAEQYTRPDGKSDFRNSKDIVFEGGIYKTSDEEIIEWLDEYIDSEKNKYGDFQVSRTEPECGSDDKPTERVVTIEKPVIPTTVLEFLGVEGLKDTLKKEYGFETESLVFDDVVAEGRAAGFIAKE